MTKVSFTEFRQNAKRYFEAAHKGEIICVTRHGEVYAEITAPKKNRIPAWKKPALRLKVPGVSFSDAIIEERREDRF